MVPTVYDCISRPRASYRHRTDRGTRHNHYRYVGTAHAEPEGLGSDANIDLRMGMLYTHQLVRSCARSFTSHR